MFAFTTPRFVPNALGIAAMQRSDVFLEQLEEVAETIKVNAQGLAPVDEGDYKDGLDVASGIDSESSVAYVNANDWKSGLIEFGTSDTSAFAPLRRGAEQAGYKLEGGRS